MKLQQIQDRLLEINEELKKLTPIVDKAEYEYYDKYRELFLGSQQSSDPKREAEARGILRNDFTELTERYHSTKIDVRVLLTEKEILIECARNARMLERNDAV